MKFRLLAKFVLTMFVFAILAEPHLNFYVFAQTSEQTQLEQQLAEIEKQIAQYEKQLSQTTKQKNTLINKINQLKTQQKKLQLQIKETALRIDNLENKITVTKKNINIAITKEARLKNAILEILLSLRAKDDNFLLDLLSQNDFNGALNEVQNYIQLSSGLETIVKQTQKVHIELASQKSQFEGQKSDAADLLNIKSLQQQELGKSLTEQNVVLTETKGLESNYNAALSDSKKRAAEIRSRIYELFNTGSQINFGQAVEIANFVNKLTGVRPAFLLAVLTQESNLGKNVGTCNRLGDPEEKSWKVIMKPTRDQEPFKKITEELGLNTDTTPVSCPMHDSKGNQVGWGGAMGPAQFIPSTWMGYKDKVSAVTGKSPANPWDIRDAFVASAIKLKDGGATSGGDGEFNSAMRYFAGSVNLKYRFYGDNVLATAKRYQADIDALGN